MTWLQIKAYKVLKALGSKTVPKVDGDYGVNTVMAILEIWRLIG